MKQERHYYRALSSAEKNIYRNIYDGLKYHVPKINVGSAGSVDQISGIYRSVLYDDPLMFYVNQQVFGMEAGMDGYRIIPEYLYTPKESRLILKEICGKVDKVLAGAGKFKHQTLRVEKYLHDSVVKSVAYDYEALKMRNCDRAHSVVGAFLDHKAVCEGIAKSFQLLCSAFEIKCRVVLGKAGTGGETEKQDYHAWNVVTIGGVPYHVDVTWDNVYHNGHQSIRYDYFNVTTEQILRDHRPMGMFQLEEQK